MKKISQLMSLLLFAGLTQYSCINDADVASADGTTNANNGNVSLLLEIPNSSDTRSAETSGETTMGSRDEYAVNSVTIYLFDAATEVFKEQHELSNITPAGVNNEHVLYTANSITVDPGTYNIFAIANGKAVGELSTQEAFLNAVDQSTYSIGKITSVPQGGFVMTNRGSANLNVTVDKPVGSNESVHVSIGLERVVAKVELTQTQENFPLRDPEGNIYCTVKINNFRMLNLATKFYTFRHTAVLDEFQEPSSYTTAENFGVVSDNNGYVIDPYFFNKTLDGAAGFTNADGFFTQALVNLDVNDSNWAGMLPAGSYSFIYCLENCMYVTSQLNAYSTGVMFRASMEIAANRVFDENKENVSNSANWPSQMFYFNYNFYTSVNAVRQCTLNNLPANITDNSTAEELAQYNIKRFQKSENYSCYYNYWIKHEDNNRPTEMGVMEFGIVRNNIYRLSVNRIAGLGDGEPYIKPEQPDEKDVELDINFNVFPWIVRAQDVELE